MATQTNAQPKKQPKTLDALNTFINMRKVAQAAVKAKYTGNNGFDAWRQLEQLSDEVLTKVSREEVIACFYRLAATNPEIGLFIGTYK